MGSVMPLDTFDCRAGNLIRQICDHVGRIPRPTNLQGIGMKHLKAPICIPEDALQVGHRLVIYLKGGHRGPCPQQSQCQRSGSRTNLNDVRIWPQRGL